MFNSVRTRLTIWYSAVLALVLISFALFTYSFLSQIVRERTDRTLKEIAAAFESNSKTELDERIDKRVDERADQRVDERIDGRDDKDNGSSKNPFSPDLLVANVLQETVSDLNFRDYRLFVFADHANKIVAQSDAASISEEQKTLAWALQNDLPKLTGETENGLSKPTFLTQQVNNRDWRLVRQKLRLNQDSLTLVVARPLTEDNGLRDEIKFVFAAAVPFALLTASLGGYFLAKKSLAPVAAMSRQAAFINHENLHERLPVANFRDEFGSLANTFNQLLARLAASFADQRRFMADASHELRTPLAIIRGESEIALSKPNRTAADYRESLEIVLDESRRMSRIVEDLMTLARVDAGQLSLSPSDLWLDELLANCIRTIRALADEKQIKIEVCIKDKMPFLGDSGLLSRMFINLLDNAIKYTERGGAVEIISKIENGFYLITISDTGMGIPPEEQPHIFKRFFRADNTRGRAETAGGSGAGLGLSIALWIAQAHNVALSLLTSNEKGTTFALSFPVFGMAQVNRRS